MNIPRPLEDSLPLSRAQRIDEACLRFEAAWKAERAGGAGRRVEDYLGGVAGPEREALLRELVALEAAYRRQRGEVLSEDEYRRRFPDLDPAALAHALAPSAPRPDPAPPAAVAERDAPGTESTAPRAQRLRCPHCHDLIQLADGQADEVLCPSCGSSFRLREARQTTTTGPMRRVGKFQLLDRVGVGAFGAVWRARDTELERLVALKIPHAGSLTEEDELERFHREARAAAQLRHPGIVTVHEVATLEGLSAIVSDFIEGVSLKDLLEVRGLTFREAATLVAQVAEAVDYAHTMGLVHRDLKPANIMIEYGRPGRGTEDDAGGGAGASGPLGRPLVMDFGLALWGEAEITLTLEGHILGTPAYMSPEQAAGKGHQADARSDVYSLGVILYELLTGELPFRGSKMMILHQVLHEEPRPPRRLNDKVPRDLETICLKALAKSPGRRYATARALAEDLGQFLKGEPVLARRVGQGEKLWRWCRRNPALAVTAALAVAAGLSLVILSLSFGVRESQHAADLKRQKEHTEDALTESRRLSAKLAWDRGQSIYEKGQVGVGLLYLSRGLTLAPDADVETKDALRAQLAAWHGQVRPLRAVWEHPGHARDVRLSPDGRTVLAVEVDGTGWLRDLVTGRLLGEPLRHTGRVLDAAFSPDGRLVVTAGVDRTARLWETATGRPITPPLRLDVGGSVAFSPDGKTLLTGGGKTARLWQAATGQALGDPLSHPSYITNVALSPDGRTAVTGCGDGTVWLWDTAMQKLRVSLRGHTGLVEAVAFSPDGQTVLTGGADLTARLWRAADGKPQGEPLRHLGPIRALAFSPSGRLVVTGADDATARVWEAASGNPLSEPLPHLGVVKAVAFGHDGATVLTGSSDGTARLWETASGKPLSEPLEHPGSEVLAVAFSADGRSLVTAGDTDVRRWDAGLARPAATVLRHPQWVCAVAFSPDGRYFLTGTGDPITFQGAVQLWDAVTPERVGPPLDHTHPVVCAAFSPDGSRFATGSGRITWGAGEVRLYETASGRLLGPALPHTGTVLGVAFSPDGRIVVSGGRDHSPGQRSGAHLWDAASGRRLRTLPHPGDVCTVAFSPDGDTVLTGGEDGIVRRWEATTGQPRGEPLPHSNWVLGAAFSPDGRTILTGCKDSAYLWDAVTGERRGAPLLHPGWVRAVAFSPDGKTLATGQLLATRGGNTVQLWEAGTGRRLGAPLRHDGWVTSAAFSPDSRRLLTGSTDRTAQLWPLKPPPLKGSAERLTLWAEVLSGKEVSRDGSVRLLDGTTWAERRRQLEEQGGSPIVQKEPPEPVSAEDLAAWHEREAKAAEQDQNWFAAVYHLDRLLPSSHDPEMHFRRGLAHLSRGHWGPAAADLAQFMKRNPDHWARWVEYGAVLLLTGEREEYRSLCARLIERYRDTTDPDVAFNVVRLCTLAPDALTRWDDVVGLAQRGTKLGPTEPWVLHMLGLAYYRAGRPEEALRCLDNSEDRVWCHSLNWLVRALVHHSRGEIVEARKWLDKAVQGADVAMVERPRGLSGPFGGHPHDWVEYHVLRREVETKLNGAKP